MDEVKRYVNLSFIIGAMVLAWLFVNISATVIANVSFLDETKILGDRVTTSTVVGIALAIVTTILLFKNNKIYNWAVDVASEMKEVTWPTLDETLYAMKVVIATSLIVAGILFCFDFVAKQLTGLILGIN